MRFEEERRYIGNLSQLFDMREMILTGGKSEGVKVISISNGSGMEMLFTADRCLDLYSLKFEGKNLGYQTPAGIVNPSYYDCHKDMWLKSYGAGFMATCGLSNIGSPCEDSGETLGLHGELANTPAEQLCAKFDESDCSPCAEISGIMRKASLFGGNLSLRRTIRVRYAVNEIQICDIIRNDGFGAQPYMTLYHFNMGYPLLSPAAVLYLPTEKVIPRTEHASAYAQEYMKITPPVSPYEEMCYYHILKKDENGMAHFGMENPESHLAVSVSYNTDRLDHFVEWKMFGECDYALGLEPCNATIDGRADARKNGTLKFLKPGESAEHRLIIRVGKNLKEIQS